VLSEDEIANLALGIPPLMPRENPGDFNLDGVIDTADFEILASNFNQEFSVLESYEKGDLVQNGRVDLNDFLRFRLIFNAPAAAAASVPEPTRMTFSIWVFVAACALTRQRRRGSADHFDG
jgi:hypothetical protein